MNIKGYIHCGVTDDCIVVKWFHFTQFAIYFSYPTWNWSYHKIHVNGFVFDLWESFKPEQKPNLSALERCPVSHRLLQYLFPHCTITTNQVMAILKLDLLIIIAQVYRLSAVHCQVTRYSQRVPGYLTRYSQCQPMKMLLEQWSSNEKCWYIIVPAKGEKKISLIKIKWAFITNERKKNK